MPSPENTAREIENQKIYTIAVTNSPSVFFFTENLAAKTKYIRAALGLHPELAAERHKELPIFFDLINKTRYIGEVGLDNFMKSPSDYKLQKMVFEKIISACSEQKNKIITIHSRRAATDVLDILGEPFPGKVIMHWYSDSLSQLKIAVRRGYYFSINYQMLQSSNGRNIIKNIPLENILLESDGPFVSMNSEPFTPMKTNAILKKLFKLNIYNMTMDELENSLEKNFKSIIL
jgi:TatD DNase family protein